MGRKYDLFHGRSSGVGSQHPAYDRRATRRCPGQDGTFSFLLHLCGLAFLFEPSAWPLVDETHYGVVSLSLELSGATTIAVLHAASSRSAVVQKSAGGSSERSASTCGRASGCHREFLLQLWYTLDYAN